MSEDDSDDKQFDATEQKLRKARGKGDIPRSQEVNAALAYLGACAAGAMAAAWAVPGWLSTTSQLWTGMGEALQPRGTVGAVSGGLLRGAVQSWGFTAVMCLASMAIPAAVVLINFRRCAASSWCQASPRQISNASIR